MKTRIILALLVLAECYSGTGCQNKDSNITAVTTVDSGAVYLHLHTNIDTNEVEDYGTIYTTSAGRKISFNLAQLYISHIQLVKANSNLYDIPGTMILKQQETEQYYVAKVAAGDYKAIRFYVGLDATNIQAAGVDTALNHPEMWFTNPPAGNYIYVNLQGSIDTTANATGTIAQMQPFVYKIGAIAGYKQIDMPEHNPVFTVLKDGPAVVHITIDYAKLFTGLAINNHNNLSVLTPGDNVSPAANTIIANIPSMFSYEE